MFCIHRRLFKLHARKLGPQSINANCNDNPKAGAVGAMARQVQDIAAVTATMRHPWSGTAGTRTVAAGSSAELGPVRSQLLPGAFTAQDLGILVTPAASPHECLV